jgi:hypothetical protein
LAAITIAAIVMLRPSTASAVEYVKVCSLFGAGYFYFPGTDTCIDVATNDARQVTAGGVWDWHRPLLSPQGEAADGRDYWSPILDYPPMAFLEAFL